MTASIKMRGHVTGAVLAAFALRVCFLWKFPFYDAGDTPIYQQLAQNWLKLGIYGLEILGRVTPVDIRTPGYPAFLAAIYTVFGESARAVMFAQALIDVLTCVLVAAMAAVLAPRESRRRVALAALWLAALCPFTANYTAVGLTETLTIFLGTLALLVLMEALRGMRERDKFGSLPGSTSVSGTEMSTNVGWVVVEAEKLAAAFADGNAVGHRTDFAVTAVGGAKLARPAHSPISRAALCRTARRIHAARLLCVDRDVAVAIWGCVSGSLEC